MLGLALAMALVSVYWWFYPHFYRASDAWQYALSADAVRRGTFLAHPPAAPIFTHRVGLVLPVALVYALLGVTPHTTTLVPLCAVLIILGVVWWVLPDTPTRVVGVLCAAASWPLRNATSQLLADVVAAAVMSLSVLVLASRDQPEISRPTRVWRGALGALLLCYAFLAKESSYWLLPVWAGALIVDLRRGRGQLIREFYLPAVTTGLVFAALYLWFCSRHFGSAFARLITIDSVARRHTWRLRSS
ncbi:MAG TPA: hypothetical protein VGP93_03650, partial [Polyangiaceae bacterium]|nr:hypothetical protein [Polyangiaceae bacterium]